VIAAAVAGTALASGLASAAVPPRTWYVEATAAVHGDGTAQHPFATLSAVQRASHPGDTIRVLPSLTALDGGIVLQRGQRLVGAGPPVGALPPGSAAPTLTNTSVDRIGGDAVLLADGALVQNLRITGTRRGAVYGGDVTDVRVSGLDVSAQNTSCAKGFLIPQFNAPTNVPGVGVPIVGGLQNGWAAILIDASSRKGGTVRLDHNRVHDARCGDGLDVRTSGSASYRVRIDHNDVRRLGQGPMFLSLLAIGLQGRDDATLVAEVDHNTETDLGNRVDLNLVQGADSEGVFVNAVGHGRLGVDVGHNTYTDPRHLGGFSANGLEAVAMDDGSRLAATVHDSSFTGSTGDVIEEGALGTNARLSMTLDHVLAQSSGPVGNTFVLPFNNGDCVLAGSLGAGNDVRLTVSHSVLRGCANNGLALGSNVVNGSGPSRRLVLDVDRTSITGNRGANLAIRNFTALQTLSVQVARTDLRGTSTVGPSLAAFSAEDLGSVVESRIDLGGGLPGSSGHNCLRGPRLSVELFRLSVMAAGDWWGQPGGPARGQTLAVGGTLARGEPLPAASGCGLG
jgi:hypothetical protein